MLGVLLAAQGLVGSVQYELKLPSEMVWVHVSLATVTWLTLLWMVAAAGRWRHALSRCEPATGPLDSASRSSPGGWTDGAYARCVLETQRVSCPQSNSSYPALVSISRHAGSSSCSSTRS